MQKRILALFAVMVMLLGVTAQATGPAYLPRVTPSLTFSGKEATCKVIVRGDASTDAVSVTMKLWNGSRIIKTWTSKGVYFVSLEKKAAVISGRTYSLTVDYKINGIECPRQSITRTCP